MTRSAGSPEPGREGRRQGSEMTNVPDPADHASHDPELIAAYAAGDAEGRDLDAAAALVERCEACQRLHADLLAISAALVDLPAPARSRDFRITADQAAALRPAGWRGLVAALAGPRFSFAAPLGTAMATLGLVGLLIAGPGLPFGTATSAPAMAPAPAGDSDANTAAPDQVTSEGLAAPSMAAASMAPSMAPASEAGEGGALGPAAESAASPNGQASATEAPLSSGSTSDLAAGGEPTSGPAGAYAAGGGSTVGPAAASPVPEAAGGAGAAGSGDTGTTSISREAAGSSKSLAAPAPQPVLFAGAALLLVAGLFLLGLRLAARRSARRAA